MALLTPRLFYIDNIVYLINEYIKDNNNNLLDCNIYLYNLKLKYFKLNNMYSFKYLEDIKFKNLIHSRIINSKLQLSLNLINCKKITNEENKMIGDIHTLDLSWSNKITDEEIKILGNLHTLFLTSCKKITDEGIKMLGNLHTLDLSSCNKIKIKFSKK
jgi:hypothetical protein